MKDVFHVGFASYESTVLPLIGASSRPLRCTTEQLKYAGVSGLYEVSARGVSSSSENVSMKRDLNKAVHLADAAERALVTEVKYRGREGGPYLISGIGRLHVAEEGPVRPIFSTRMGIRSVVCTRIVWGLVRAFV